MNKLGTIAAAAALATAALWSAGASAATVCSGCAYNGNTYLGTHNPTTEDLSTFTHPSMAVGAFTDTWLFSINPAGSAAINATFIPTANISNYDIKLYNVTATCGAMGTSCTGVTVGSLIADADTGPNFLANLPSVTLGVGLYAFQVTGTVTQSVGGNNGYSGNLTTARVPEPGSLALVALGLIGAAGLRRRAAR